MNEEQKLEVMSTMEEETALTIAFRAFGMKANKLAHHKGLWDAGVGEVPAVKIAKMHAELSEALNALQQPVMQADKHLPNHNNLTVEFADVVLQIFDFAEEFFGGGGAELAEAIRDKHLFNLDRPYKHNKRF